MSRWGGGRSNVGSSVKATSRNAIAVQGGKSQGGDGGWDGWGPGPQNHRARPPTTWEEEPDQGDAYYASGGDGWGPPAPPDRWDEESRAAAEWNAKHPMAIGWRNPDRSPSEGGSVWHRGDPRDQQGPRGRGTGSSPPKDGLRGGGGRDGRAPGGRGGGQFDYAQSEFPGAWPDVGMGGWGVDPPAPAPPPNQWGQKQGQKQQPQQQQGAAGAYPFRGLDQKTFKLPTFPPPTSRTFEFAHAPTPTLPEEVAIREQAAARDRIITTYPIAESFGACFAEARIAFFGQHRPSSERFFWSLPNNHDDRVKSLLEWIDQMSWPLANLGVQKLLQSRSRGALFSNAAFRPWNSPKEPAFDFMPFSQLQKTLDPALQGYVATYDVSSTCLVFVFLVSESGNSTGIWMRKLVIPPSIQLKHAVELAKVKGDLSRTPHKIILGPSRPVSPEAPTVIEGPPDTEAGPSAPNLPLVRTRSKLKKKPRKKKEKKLRKHWWQFWRPKR